MTADRPFLEAIKAAPDDDAPRLVFADFLDEHGEPARAELIRVQCRQVVRPSREAYLRLCRHALRAHFYFNGTTSCNYRDLTATKWLAGTPGGWRVDRSRGPDGRSVGQVPMILYRRGFGDQVRMPAADWLAHADALTAAHPVREVRGTGDLRSWQFWQSMDRKVSGAFYRGPCPNWQELEELTHKLQNRTGTDGRPVYVSDQELAEAILSFRWPGIKFHLPEPANVRGRLVTLPNDWLFRDYSDADFASAREAGRRAAEEENRRFWETFQSTPERPT